MRLLKQMRAAIRPDILQAIDGFGAVFPIRLFFCLLNAAYDGVAKRNRQFDPERWWHPVYRIFHPEVGS
jgi:hypothetical protein